MSASRKATPLPGGASDVDPSDTGVTLATIWKASKALDVKLVEMR